MSVDLRSNSMFARSSLLIMPDGLVRLEHNRTSDRVRRFMFDSIDTVLVWRTMPWVRIVVCGVCFVLPGAAMQLAREPGLNIVGYVLIAIGLIGIIFYAVCRVTTIRLVRNGEPYDIKGVFRPKKVRKLRDKLLAGIEATRANATTAELPATVADLPVELPIEPAVP